MGERNGTVPTEQALIYLDVYVYKYSIVTDELVDSTTDALSRITVNKFAISCS